MVILSFRAGIWLKPTTSCLSLDTIQFFELDGCEVSTRPIHPAILRVQKKLLGDVDLPRTFPSQVIHQEQVRIAAKSRYEHELLHLRKFDREYTMKKEKITHYTNIGRMSFDLR